MISLILVLAIHNTFPFVPFAWWVQRRWCRKRTVGYSNARATARAWRTTWIRWSPRRLGRRSRQWCSRTTFWRIMGWMEQWVYVYFERFAWKVERDFKLMFLTGIQGARKFNVYISFAPAVCHRHSTCTKNWKWISSITKCSLHSSLLHMAAPTSRGSWMPSASALKVRLIKFSDSSFLRATTSCTSDSEGQKAWLRWTKKLVQKLVAARVPLENCFYNPLPVLLFYVPVAVNPPPHECRSGADAAQHARRLVAHASLVASVVAVVVLVRVW